MEVSYDNKQNNQLDDWTISTMRNIFKKDAGQQLIDFVKRHSNLNAEEKKIIFDATHRLENPKVFQEQELLNVIHALRELSLKSRLSNDVILLKKLHRGQWLAGLLNVTTFFGK